MDNNLIIAFGAAIIGGLLTGAFSIGGVILANHISIKREESNRERERKKKANYLAVDVISELEKFISECTVIIVDKETFSNLLNDVISVRLASPPKYATNIDWTSIDSDLMLKIFSSGSTIRMFEIQLDAIRKNPKHLTNKNINLIYATCIRASYSSLTIVDILRSRFEIPEIGKISQDNKDIVTNAYNEVLKKDKEEEEKAKSKT